jgi:3D (Asp-Asp-Asp) domain-containing protein
VRRPGRGFRTFCCVVLAGAALCATLPAASVAETVASLELEAEALRAENAALEASSQFARASLTAIESRGAQARAELAAFRTRAMHVHERRRAVAEELGIARGSLRASQRALAARLRTLYEHGETDTLAVILGAGSLDSALSAVETLDLAARPDEDLLASARAVSRRLVALARALADRERELEQLAAARAAAAASLADARAERLSATTGFRAVRSANRTRITALGDQARALASVEAPPTPILAASNPPATAVAAAAAAEPPHATAGIRSLTVLATGYALRGRTASGRPVGWGAVAVDPGVIPMSSRLSIPGYGIGVATDTGGAIKGARIDLWFPSVTQARAWGSRVVTITIYRD